MNKTLRLLYKGAMFAIFLPLTCCGQPTKEEVTVTQNNAEIHLGEKILVIFEDSQHNIWFGGNDQGVFRYDGNKLELFTPEDGLLSNSVIGIQEDKAGNLYFDTPEGVNVYDGEHFDALILSDKVGIENQWKLENGDLWFKIDGNSSGPYRYDGTHLYHLKFPENEIGDQFYEDFPGANYNPYGIYHIYKDKKGNVWFGTSSAGFFRFDGHHLNWFYEEQLQRTPAGGDFGMRAMIEDSEGHYWFNNPTYRFEILGDSVDGALSYNRLKGLTEGFEPLEIPYFLSVTEGKDGDLWMSTYDDGVWRKKGEELIHYPVKQGEQNVLLFTIYTDHMGGIWLGSHNGGVFQFNGDEFIPFNP